MPIASLLAVFSLAFSSPELSTIAAPSMQERWMFNGPSDAQISELTDKLQDAQVRLRRGDKPVFLLTSGSIAFYEKTQVSPRDAFLDLAFSNPSFVRRQPSDNPTNTLYHLEYWLPGEERMVWDVDISLSSHGEITMVSLFYRRQHPS